MNFSGVMPPSKICKCDAVTKTDNSHVIVNETGGRYCSELYSSVEYALQIKLEIRN